MNLVEKLKVAFPFSDREIKVLIRTAPRRYKVHFIEKRHGRGMREIAQPTSELKAVQRWLVDSLLSELPIHSAAVAYRPGLSIKDHAQPHAAAHYLLKLDFQNFFPSIEARDIRTHLSRFLNFSLQDQTSIIRLLCREEKNTRRLFLSIGAPSSPFISNTILFDFDCVVDEICRNAGVTYTRYADDLALSTNRPFLLADIEKKINEICTTLSYPRLRLNQEKTVFTSKKFSRQLTGLTLSNDGIASLGREKKRQIRAMAFNYSRGNLTAEEKSKLRGLISFSLSIDDRFVATLEKMLGEESFATLMRAGN